MEKKGGASSKCSAFFYGIVQDAPNVQAEFPQAEKYD